MMLGHNNLRSGIDLRTEFCVVQCCHRKIDNGKPTHKTRGFE